MKVMLTSCGLETDAIKQAFLTMLPKPRPEICALFITAAVNSPDAVEVLPKCLNDLLKCGISRDNITVSDLYDSFSVPIYKTYDVVYICGGSTACLLRRIWERGFQKELESFIAHNGVVLGVSAGSIIFAENLPDNLGLLACGLDVHCEEASRIRPGSYPRERQERIRLGNRQGIIVTEQKITVFE